MDGLPLQGRQAATADHSLDAISDSQRLAALRRFALLDTPAEAAFDRLTRLATNILEAPVALISVVDEDRQFFKSCIGLPEPWASWRETPLSHSFCQHVVASGSPLVVTDAREHPLLCDNLAIPDLGVVAYLGVPLTTEDGQTLGTLCVIDHQPRSWSEKEIGVLTELAALVMAEIEQRVVVVAQRQVEEQLREENHLITTLQEIGRAMAAELDLQKLVQVVTDGATDLTGAAFGAFFYNVTNEKGETYSLYTLSGAPPEAFAHFPMPRNTAIFGPTFHGEAAIRLDDVTQDPRYGQNPPYHGMPEGHLPVKSYLAAPVISRRGEVLGGLFLGHPEPAVFTRREEQLLHSFAAHAAVAIDNARLYEEAQEAVRLRDLFLSIASHELRTPLTTILGLTELLERRARAGEALPRRIRKAFEMIHKQAQRLNQLVELLLDVSRIEADGLALEQKPFDLISLVQKEVESTWPILEQHQVMFSNPQESLVVLGDEVRLEQVFQNLLQNAIKYSPDGGVINVQLARNDEFAVLAVSDEGIGIPPGSETDIFNRFYRAKNVKSNNISGLGLGLYLAKEIVLHHGGTIRAFNKQGRGATFEVQLPLYQPN
ncbi:MAG: GAF domain-containing protein [Chloroflexota bacterium]|nr:GAF domain-containing protein [Chloroflexota bacterium]